MIRIDRIVPRVGITRVRRVFLLLPKTLPSGSIDSTTVETRWLGFTYVRQRYEGTSLNINAHSWVDKCFEDAPSQDVHND